MRAKASGGTRIILVGLAIMVGLVFLTNCTNFRAYYNTFFLAEKTFKAAEENRKRSKTKELDPTTKRLYEEAITKASRILAFYPKSKYVDDALLMIGESYYYTNEFSKAERKFQEVITGFPKSNLYGEAHYFLGLTYFKLEDFARAGEVWKGILENPKQKKLHNEVLFQLAELKYVQEEYAEAVPLYHQFLTKYAKDEKAALAQKRIAECHWLNDDYEKAAKAYAGIKNLTKDKELIYQGEYMSGLTAYQLKRYSEGMAIYRKLAENSDYYPHLAEIKLQLALGLQQTGQIEEALKSNQEVIETYPKTAYSAQAYYQQGVIHQENKGDLNTAKELFDKAKDEKTGSEYSKKALQKSADITKLEEYKKQLSEGEADKIVETQFQLAEFYLTHLNQPDSALTTYKNIVADHPQSNFAPKALLAVAYICRNLIEDSAGCRQACEELLRDYPGTDYSLQAAKMLERAPMESDTLSAALLFNSAEEQLFTLENSDSALMLYEKILALYPQSVYAPKALLGRAHILEHAYTVTEDTLLSDSTLYLAYAEIMEKYPDSEAAGVARLKLGLKAKPQPKPVQPKPAEGDTTRPAIDTTASAVADTADTLVLGLPLAPEPISKGNFVYPPELIGEQISGWVFVKLEIDYFTGEVRQAEVMKGVHHEIDRRVLEVMKAAKFDTQKLDPKNFNSIYGYRFKVKAPVSGNP